MGKRSRHTQCDVTMPKAAAHAAECLFPRPAGLVFLAEKRGCLATGELEVEFLEGDAAANTPPKMAASDFDVGDGHAAT